MPTLITPAPVCANMIQTLVHTCRGLGCCFFIEINVKRQSIPSPLKEFNIEHCSAHTVFSQAQLLQNIISKSVCLLGTKAGVIRVLTLVTTAHSQSLFFNSNFLLGDAFDRAKSKCFSFNLIFEVPVNQMLSSVIFMI